MKKIILGLLFLLTPTLGWCTDYTQDAACKLALLMNDVTGTVATDSCLAGGVNNGQVEAGVTINQTGQVGKAYAFNGTSGGLLDNFTTQTFLSTSFSIGGWFKITSLATGGLLIGRMNSAGFHHNYYLVQDSGLYKFGFWSGSYNEISGGSIDTGWHHIVATWNTADTKQRLYIDGAPITTGSSLGAQTLNDAGSLNVGRDTAGGVSTTGTFDEVFMFSRALSDAEVLDIYTNGLGATGGGGGGTTVYVNNHHLY